MLNYLRSAVFSSPLLVAILLPVVSKGQERCGTVQYTEKLKQNKQIPVDDMLFENWLSSRMATRSSRDQRKKGPPYVIPVVVHILHKGEPIGTGSNISDAQILSQIKVLNEDFNRLNDDANETPAEFQSLAGSMDIEFVLAKQDPEGLETNGIIRVKGEQDTWVGDDNYIIKSQSYWPAEDYLNIWVCDLVDELVGYAQFPESTIVTGLENFSQNRLTDGVVVWHKAFGSIDDGPFILDPDFNKGRTVTHETGHYLGLRHIWGDDSGTCSGTDYVSDTPNQASSTSGCPTHPRSDNCSEAKMFQNFLDYTDDQCMNLFTVGQINRMMIVLENSPRRESLLTSVGATTPTQFANDLGLRTILDPLDRACTNSITPTVEVRNYGTNSITSATVQVTINGLVVETKEFDLNLTTLQTAELSFGPHLINTGTNSLTVTIIETNGVTDGSISNNMLSSEFALVETIDVPFAEYFIDEPEDWRIENYDQQKTWTLVTAPKETQGNKAMMLNFYDYEDAYGEQDVLFSPQFDLSTSEAALLVFDMAHARYQTSNDRLQIVVLRDCEPLTSGTIVFDKQGAALATTTSTAQSFLPDAVSDWKTIAVDMTDFLGEAHLQIAFVAINDWGNNLYLDDVSLTTSRFEDLSLSKLTTPSPVTCNSNPAPTILITNVGSVPITTFKVLYTVNDGTSALLTITGQSIPPQSEQEITIPQITLEPGENLLTLTVVEPNGQVDVDPSNNTIETTIIVNDSRERIPLREEFTNIESPWIVANPDGNVAWEITDTNFGNSYYFNSFGNEIEGDQSWLVSPVLDFSQALQVTLQFDFSHRAKENREDLLRVMVSQDCGNTFNEIEINDNPSFINDEWFPMSLEDWQENYTLSLNDYAGDPDVRVAFVVTNKNGNNFYVDNIEFYTTPIAGAVVNTPFSIYGYYLEDALQTELKVSFNLEQRQDVSFSIVDMMGKFQADGVLRDVLNQTFPLDLATELAPGLYIVRMNIAGRHYSERILVQN